MLTRFLIFLNTVRYLKLIQIWKTLIWIFKNNKLKSRIVRYTERLSVKNTVKRYNLYKKITPSLNSNLEILSFTFLNHNVVFKDKINWNNPAQEKLWLYNLHYFDYLLPLTKEINENNYALGKRVIYEWIENNSIGCGNGWEAYPLSLRIPNWIYFFDCFYDFINKDKEFKKIYLNNLYRQSFYLTYFLEFHIMANHLLANIKALIWAGLFFQNKKWTKKGFRLLKQELKEQILLDGAHYERSPMYHSIILNDVLDIVNFIKRSDFYNSIYTNKLCQNEISLELLIATAYKMLNWLKYMIHPDGQIALFGDSAFGIAPTYKQLNDYYLQLSDSSVKTDINSGYKAMEESGYCIFKTNEQYLVIDGGELGVTYQPGHAHCDLFSYEYSYQNIRFIVDSGVGNYLPSDIRHKARSIYSHNTVVVNKMEQAEIWKAFRMGRRVRPGKINFKESDKPKFKGKYFNSLNKKKAYAHSREVVFVDNKFFHILDLIDGKKLNSVENLVHLHPECKITIEENKIKLSRDQIHIFILFNEKIMSVKIKEWFYVPEFGKSLDSKMLVFSPTYNDLHELFYFIVPEHFLKSAKTYFLTLSY